MIWVSPVLPMTEQGVREVSEIGERIFHEHGFEYQVTFSQVSDRALCAVQSIQFDRRSPEETERAAACHDTLVQSLLARGYVPYRGTPGTVALLRHAAPGFWQATEDLKRGLDPEDVVAPGRYVRSRRPE
jgi:4-cresol dehydrogenase (hydroxylating)